MKNQYESCKEKLEVYRSSQCRRINSWKILILSQLRFDPRNIVLTTVNKELLGHITDYIQKKYLTKKDKAKNLDLTYISACIHVTNLYFLLVVNGHIGYGRWQPSQITNLPVRSNVSKVSPQTKRNKILCLNFKFRNTKPMKEALHIYLI